MRSPPDFPPHFHTTRWTRVAEAQGKTPEARAALADLCQAYYNPVLAFVRTWSHQREQQDVEDLTQGFFASLLASDKLTQAEPARGKFRTYLLGAVKHFLLKQRQAATAQKRGGGQETIPFPSSEGSTAHGTAPSGQIASNDLPPDAQFDKAWALATLDLAMEALQKHYDEEGKQLQFQTLKPWLTGAYLAQAAAASQLEMSETAVKVAIHRLRQRFRQTIRQQLAQTLLPQCDVDEEMRHLLAALVA